MIRSAAGLETIVDRIYEAALDERLWPEVVTQLAKASGGYGGALILWDTAKGYVPVAHQSGFPEEVWSEYGSHYIGLDPRSAAFTRQPELELYTDEILVDPDELRRNEAVNYIYSRCDQRHGYGARLFQSRSLESALILARTGRQGAAQSDDLAVLNKMLPHLRRSITLSRRIGQQVSVAALEALSFGVAVLDGAGRVSFANRRMLQIAADDDGVQLSSHGLALARADEDAAYQRTVERLRRQRYFEAAPRRIALPVSRPSGKRPYAILVCPFLHSQSVLPDSGQSLLVCVSDPAETGQFDEELLGALFALTPAEARLAVGLIKFGTLPAAAAACGVTEGSARQYLKRIYGKTGTQGQADLVALLLGSVRA